MPAFVVALPERTGYTLKEGVNRIVVQAADATEAKLVARAHFGGDTDAAWNDATATQIAAGTSLPGYEAFCNINGPDLNKKFSAQGRLGAVSAAVQTGGSAYVVGDIITVVGGTLAANPAGHAARFRVTTVSTGAITGLELVDPGSYSALPANPAAVTGGTGTGATLNLTSGTEAFSNLLASLVDALNGDALIAGATMNLAAATLLFTVAAAGDSLGDHTFSIGVRKNGVEITHATFFGAETEGGAAGAALTVAVAAAAPTLPNVVLAAKA